MPHRLGIHAASRYPADPRAIFILALVILAGLTLLVTGAKPGTMDALLPHWGVVLWGVSLLSGSALTLAGMAKQTVNGVIVEQVGAVTTGVATVVYGTSILLLVGGEATVAAAYSMGFGLSCFWRWAQLQVWLQEQKTVVEASRCNNPHCTLPGHRETPSL